MKILFLLPALIFIAFGFTSNQQAAEYLPGITRPAIDILETVAPRMRTSTSNIYKGEEIRLDLMAPNPAYLGVIDPEGNFFYIVYPSENGFGGLKPFVASEDFKYMWQLNINTQQFKADPYVYGVDENQPVFTKSGNYTFILGDNLHVDDPSMLTKVTVAYHHQLRTDINVVAIP